MNKQPNYIFKCPRCGDTGLRQQMTNVDVETAMTVTAEGHVKYGLSENSGDCEVIGFCCRKGHFLTDGDGQRITTDEDLAEWFDHPAFELDDKPTERDELDDVEVSHGELVHRIANAYEQLGGEEMAELWNELFPGMTVRYISDSMYRWVKT